MNTDLVKRCRAEMTLANYLEVSEKYEALAEDEETKGAIHSLVVAHYHMDEAKHGME